MPERRRWHASLIVGVNVIVAVDRTIGARALGGLTIWAPWDSTGGRMKRLHAEGWN
jgi:hypothetical protein